MIQLIRFENIDGDYIYVNENAIAGFTHIRDSYEIVNLNLIGEVKGIAIKSNSLYLKQALDKSLV